MVRTISRRNWFRWLSRISSKENISPVYGDGSNVRDWLYVEDHCKAIDLVVREGKDGEVYNVGGHNEKNKPRNRKTDYFNYPPLMAEKPEYRQVLKKKGERRKTEIFRSTGSMKIWLRSLKTVWDMTNVTPSILQKITNALGWYPETKIRSRYRKDNRMVLGQQAWVEEVTRGDYQGYYEKDVREMILNLSTFLLQ